MKRTVLITSFLLILAGCTPVTEWRAASVEVPAPVELPLRLANRGVPFVEIEKDTYAMLDTGAFACFVSQKYVKDHHLTMRDEPTLEIRDAQYRASKSHYVVRIEDLNLGGVHFRDFDAIVDRSGRVAGTLAIVIGRPLFREALITIDYPRRKLIIAKGSLPEPNGHDVLPIERDNRGNLRIPITIAGSNTWALFDTGAAAGGTPLSRERIKSMKWATPPVAVGKTQSWFGSERLRMGRMDGDFRLGQYTIRRPIVVVSDSMDDDFLGGDILQHFAVTIDLEHDRIRFTRPPGDGPAPIEPPSIRILGFGLQHGTPYANVPPDSAAHRAGLRSGDRIISIDGLELSRLTDEHMDAIERRGQPILVQVARDRTLMQFSVPMVTLVP